MSLLKLSTLAAALALAASPAIAANNGTLKGVDIAAITSAGKSNNDDVGATITFLNALLGRTDVTYIGTLEGLGNNAPGLPAGQSISGSISGTTASYTSSLYTILAYDVKASSNNALYLIAPGLAPGVVGYLDSTAIKNNGGQIPAISHADFFGVRVSAVPEPGTWAMILLGFGGMGVSLRRRRKPVALQIA